jgi:hypothetical protein
MEQYYFIPTSSINYNNVLASESISPPAFYAKRGYGFRRFEKVTPSPLNHSFLAYSEIPKFSLKNSEREEFPLFIAVPKDYLSTFKVIDKGEFQIVQIDGTIYLNPEVCFFLAGSEKEKLTLIASTQRSVEVKRANEYNDVVYSIDKFDLGSFIWKDSYLNELLDGKNINESLLKKDQKINKLKGLLYGYGAGKMMGQSDDLISGRRYFQDFVNIFSSLMNELSYLSTSKNRVGFVSKNLESTFGKLIDLQNLIGETLGKNDQIRIKSAIIRDFGIDEDFVKSMKSANYQKDKTTLFSIISNFIKSKEIDQSSVEDLLGQLIQKASNLSNYGSAEGYRKLEGDFDKIMSLIKAKISSIQSKEISGNKLDSLPFKVTPEMGIEIEKGLMPEEEIQLFEVISNEFLERLALSSSDEIGQHRLEFVKTIGNTLRDLSYKQGVDELHYLGELYSSLKTVGVGFKPFHIDNIALQSLACFMMRYAELGKLQDYMDKNGVKNFEYAYSYWGAAYGYANLSKLFIEPLTGNPVTIHLINDFLARFIGHGEYKKGTAKSYVSRFKIEYNSPIPIPIKTKSKFSTPDIPRKSATDVKFDEIKNDQKQTFGEILKLKSSFANNNDWILALVELGKKAEEDTKREKRLFQSQKNPLTEFSAKIKKAGKNMTGFGAKKIEEAVNLFAEYLTNE